MSIFHCFLWKRTKQTTLGDATQQSVCDLLPTFRRAHELNTATQHGLWDMAVTPFLLFQGSGIWHTLSIINMDVCQKVLLQVFRHSGLTELFLRKWLERLNKFQQQRV